MIEEGFEIEKRAATAALSIFLRKEMTDLIPVNINLEAFPFVLFSQLFFRHIFQKQKPSEFVYQIFVYKQTRKGNNLIFFLLLLKN